MPARARKGPKQQLGVSAVAKSGRWGLCYPLWTWISESRAAAAVDFFWATCRQVEKIWTNAVAVCDPFEATPIETNIWGIRSSISSFRWTELNPVPLDKQTHDVNLFLNNLTTWIYMTISDYIRLIRSFLFLQVSIVSKGSLIVSAGRHGVCWWQLGVKWPSSTCNGIKRTGAIRVRRQEASASRWTIGTLNADPRCWLPWTRKSNIHWWCSPLVEKNARFWPILTKILELVDNLGLATPMIEWY